MTKIYTSLDEFKSTKFEVLPYRELDENFVDWIEKTTEKLLKSRSPIELKSYKELQKTFGEICPQPYFMILGRSYFLDFYLPQERVAVEIDGKQHKDRRDIDKKRDMYFGIIGVRTIRVKSEIAETCDVGELVKKIISSRTSSKNKRKRMKVKRLTKEEKRQKVIAKALNRIKEHDRNMLKAKWY